jgi:hypothetical protein
MLFKELIKTMSTEGKEWSDVEFVMSYSYDDEGEIYLFEIDKEVREYCKKS